METLGSVASVIAAIRDEAGAEVEKLERAPVEVPPDEEVAVGDRETRLAAAQRDNRERIAQQEWEARRTLVEQREAWIARVRQEAHRRWSEGFADRAEKLTALAREALERIPGDRCEIAVCARDSEALRPRDLAKSTGKKEVTIAPQPANIAGGCVVTAADVAFDNSFEERSRRFEAEWRRALSALYRA